MLKKNVQEFWEKCSAGNKRKMYLLRPDPSKVSIEFGFAELLAYSGLVHNLNRVKGEHRRAGLTMTKLAALTGLHRSTTLPKTIRKLASYDLVYQDGLSWHARQDSQNMFFKRREKRNLPWYSEFMFVRMLTPAINAPLSSRQNALFWTLITSPGKLPIYYSNGLLVDRKTIATSLEKLQTLELIDASNNAKLPEDLSFWADGGKKIVRTKIDPYAGIKFAPVHPKAIYSGEDEDKRVRRYCAEAVAKCRANNWSDSEIYQAFGYLFETTNLEYCVKIRDLCFVLDHCEGVFRGNQAKYDAKNSKQFFQYWMTYKYDPILEIAKENSSISGNAIQFFTISDRMEYVASITRKETSNSDY